EVNTKINLAVITTNKKFVDKEFATVGDTITYTINYINTGNTTANNVILIDTIPNGTTFVPNSVFLNNVNSVGEVVEPPTGLNIGNIGVNQLVTVSFSVVVDTIPVPNPIPNFASTGYDYIVDEVSNISNGNSTTTNTVTTTVNFANINSPVKFVDKKLSDIGDTLTYTIVFKNTGNVTANNVVFTDTIPNDTTFVVNSVFVNNTNRLGENPQNGISIGSVGANKVVTITFKVTVDTIPSPNPIPNTGNIGYNFIVNETIPTTVGENFDTNTVNTLVSHANLGNIQKFVSRESASCSDVITYTIVIPNTGNVVAQNVIINDTIPNGTMFVTNSVTIDGVNSPGQNPMTGINVGNIAANTTKTVTFDVLILC
ncbi:MAG: DUF11 domain-containing protein, partial [Peptostreptococcaceae bacterium]